MRRQAPLWASALAASTLVAPAVRAETLYVIEQLVVGVSSAPDSSGQKVGSIHSGDAVEVLERQGDQIHVRLGNGSEGWVRKSYLSAEQPLQHRLSERTAEVDKLKQDVTRLETELAAVRSITHGKLGGSTASNTNSSGVRRSPPAGDGANREAADPSTHEPAFFMTPPDEPARPLWQWAAALFLVALALGFFLGWQVLDRRIRRKYGGLRIY